jgi:hypothetical protein
VKRLGGKIVQATVKAVVDTPEGVRLPVSFREETARIYLWQIVEEGSQPRGGVLPPICGAVQGNQNLGLVLYYKASESSTIKHLQDAKKGANA